MYYILHLCDVSTSILANLSDCTSHCYGLIHLTKAVVKFFLKENNSKADGNFHELKYVTTTSHVIRPEISRESGFFPSK